MATSQYAAHTAEQPPERGPRKGEGKMERDEFGALVGSLIREADGYAQTLERQRETATDFFHGRQLGNEKPGRSQVIITEVRDKILGILPDLMALLFGKDRAIEYVPTSPEKVSAVEQITDFVTKISIETDNQGFLLYHSVLLDGLIRKTGAFKWFWSEESSVKHLHLMGLTREDLQLIAAEDGVEFVKTTISDLSTPGQPLYDVELRKPVEGGKAVIAAIPNEELIFLPSTRRVDDTIFIAHKSTKTRGELISMGVPDKLVDDFGGGDDNSLDTSPSRMARAPDEAPVNTEENAGPSNQRILYIEGYARIDFDGDGVSELRKVCTIGPGYHVVMNEPVDEVPISVWCPIPEPHELVGQSYADLTMDLQRIKSAVTRGILDSLSTAIFPRTWFKENDALLSDVMATEIGAPIRTRTGAGAVGTFQHTFVGKDAFPLLTYFDEVSERRTGSPGAQGIDMDALQSTEKGAAGAAIAANRKHTELVARLFAEMALKPMYRGLYKLIKQHQPKERMVRLRGEWVQVDPRAWDDDLDVTVNVALGQAPKEVKMATLAGIKATQESYLQTLGAENPIVGLGHLRYTLGEMAELAGYDSTKFFKQLPLDWAPPPPPPGSQPPPSPEMALVQVEAQKAQAQIEAKKVEQQLKMQQMQAEQQLKMQQLQAEHSLKMQQLQAELAFKERELALKEVELSAKYGLEAQKVDAQVEKLAAETRIKEETAAHDMDQSDAQAAHKASLDERKAAASERETSESEAPKAAPSRRKIRVKKVADGDYEVEETND